MKFSVSREGFKNVLGVMIKAVSPIATDPRLAGVLIKVEKGKARLKTTNLDLYITAEFACDVKEEGAILLPARLLYNIFNILPGDIVVFEEKETGCQILCDQAVYNLRKIAFKEWFEAPKIEQTSSFELPLSKIGTLAKKVVCSTSRDDSRPILQGIQICNQPREVTLSATDGIRIAQAKNVMDEDVENAAETVVPGAILVSVADLGKFGEIAEFNISDNLIEIKCEGFDIVFSKLAGKFPNIKSLIQDKAPVALEVLTDDLVRGVQRIALLSSDFPIVKFSINPNTKMLHLSGKAEDVGKCDDDIPCECNVETTIEVSFNCKFLLEGLASIEGEKTRILLTSAEKPGIFCDLGECSYAYVLLPVK